MSKDKRELELKRLYKLASKLSGRYKLLFKDTSRFTVGLLDTTAYEEGLDMCDKIDTMISDTDIFN